MFVHMRRREEGYIHSSPWGGVAMGVAMGVAATAGVSTVDGLALAYAGSTPRQLFHLGARTSSAAICGEVAIDGVQYVPASVSRVHAKIV